MPSRLQTLAQKDAYHSPWSLRARLGVGIWQIVHSCLFRTTPKPLNRWRLLLLKIFGAKVSGRPFVASSASIKMPWHLVFEDRACIGPRADIYNLGIVTLRERCTIAQEAYLCGGSHDFAKGSLPLVVGPIEIGADAFICARAFVLPGITVGAGALVGACAVVTRDVEAWTVVVGNPARPVGTRHLDRDA